MGAIIQNGQIGAIIKNGIVYGGGAIGGGGSDISEIIRIDENTFFNGTPTFDADGYTYEIETTSTGGGDASIQITEYYNGTEVQSVNWLYSLTPKPDIFEDILVDYGTYHSLNWTVLVKANKGVRYNGNDYIGGTSDPTEVVYWGYQSTIDYEFEGGTTILTPYQKDDDKIYLVTNEVGDMIKCQYQGNKRILRKQDISEYEFWYEDLFFPIGMAGGGASYVNKYDNYWINTGIKLFSTENINKDWQLEFNVKNIKGSGSSGDGTVFGTNTNSGRYFEFYFNSQTNLYVYGDSISDHNCGDAYNKDVIIKCENKVLTVSIDGTVVHTVNLSSTTDDNNIAYIANYRGSYCFNGIMNYIGFKWLTSPTPSGADGLTYELSVDNNYHINIVEYDNGVQSQTTSLNDEDLDYGSTPVTFGDLIISYGVNDVFVVKPNYNDNKAIKYNDVLYSGNNEILSLPDYYESDTYTLTGWIE